MQTTTTTTTTSTSTTREMIAEEERLIRICQAELALRRKSAEWHNSNSNRRVAPQDVFDTDNNNHELQGDEEEDDWLEQTLEALQQSSSGADSNSTTVQFDQTFHVDPALYDRLLPHVAGMVVTNVQNLTPSAARGDSIIQQRAYRMQARLCAAKATPFVFSVTLTVQLPSADTRKEEGENSGTSRPQARVVGLQVEYQPVDDEDGVDESPSCVPVQELSAIAQVAAETCSLPVFVNHLQSFASFDHERTRLLESLQQELGDNNDDPSCPWRLERRSAQVFAVSCTTRDRNDNLSVKATTNDNTICSFVLEWKWSVAWHRRGREEIKIMDIVVPATVSAERGDQDVNVLRDPHGLEQLVQCLGGNVPAAIRIMVETIRQSSASHDESPS